MAETPHTATVPNMMTAMTTAATVTMLVCIIVLLASAVLVFMMWAPDPEDEPVEVADDDGEVGQRPAATFEPVAHRAQTAQLAFDQLAEATPVDYRADASYPPVPTPTWMAVPDDDGSAAATAAAIEDRRLLLGAAADHELASEMSVQAAAAADAAANRLDEEADATDARARQGASELLGEAVLALRHAASQERAAAGQFRDEAAAHTVEAAACKAQVADIEAELIRSAQEAARRVEEAEVAARQAELDAAQAEARRLAEEAEEAELARLQEAEAAQEVARLARLAEIAEIARLAEIAELEAAAEAELAAAEAEAQAQAAIAAQELADAQDAATRDALEHEVVELGAWSDIDAWVDIVPMVEDLSDAVDADTDGSPVWPPPTTPAVFSASPVDVIAPNVVERTSDEFESDIADAARLAVAASHELPAGVTYAELALIEVDMPDFDMSAAFDPEIWAAPDTVEPAADPVQTVHTHPLPAGVTFDELEQIEVRVPDADVRAAFDPEMWANSPEQDEELYEIHDAEPTRRERAAAARAERKATRAAAAQAKREQRYQAAQAKREQREQAAQAKLDLAAQTKEAARRDAAEVVADGFVYDGSPEVSQECEPGLVEAAAPSAPADTADSADQELDDLPASFADESAHDVGLLDEISAEMWETELAAPDDEPAAPSYDEWNTDDETQAGLGAGASYDPDMSAPSPPAPAAKLSRSERRAAKHAEPGANPTVEGFNRPGAFGDAGEVGSSSAAFAELVTLPAPAEDDFVELGDVTGIPGGDIDDLLEDTRPIGPSGRPDAQHSPESSAAMLDVPLTPQQAKAQAKAAKRKAAEAVAERRKLERQARKAGVSVESLLAPEGDVGDSAAWQSPSWVSDPREIRPVVTPGDTVDYATFDLPEPIPDRPEAIEVDERIANIVDVPTGKASNRWQTDD